MAKTTIPCPNCRTPIVAEITRLFDLNTDPEAKEKLLSGSANYITCPVCHYQGVYPTPIVYHDPDKELLLTFFPSEAHTPVPEQERILGPLIKKAVDDLPMEKRKAYLFQPQTMLTQQRLFETILQADGITPEMMKAQQEKLSLIQQLAIATPDALPTLIAQQDEKIDEQVFVLLSKLAQASSAGGDQQGAQILVNLQKALLQYSTFGKAMSEQAAETQAAVQSLQELSKTGLTRESLLDLIIQSSESDIRLTAIVTMARSGLDYQFFQLLSEKIEAAGSEDTQNLIDLREKLLKLTQEVDNALKEQTAQAQILLDELLKSDNLEEAIQEALPRVNQAFADLVNHEAYAAQAANDQEKLKKLSTIIAVIQSASASSMYIEVIEMLLQAQDEKARQEIMESADEVIDEDFMQMLSGLISQMEGNGNQPKMVAKLKDINREVLRFSMKKNLNKQEPD
ncbi:MAG: CpXC domain-containing protein [Anaerolineaceae bacterium]